MNTLFDGIFKLRFVRSIESPTARDQPSMRIFHIYHHHFPFKHASSRKNSTSSPPYHVPSAPPPTLRRCPTIHKAPASPIVNQHTDARAGISVKGSSSALPTSQGQRTARASGELCVLTAGLVLAAQAAVVGIGCGVREAAFDVCFYFSDGSSVDA